MYRFRVSQYLLRHSSMCWDLQYKHFVSMTEDGIIHDMEHYLN